MTPRVQALYDEDMTDDGFVRNTSRFWAYQPETHEHLLEVVSEAFEPSGLGVR